MSADRIIVDGEPFEVVELPEERMEALFQLHGAALWPGFTYVDFKPPISGGEGVRHPDGALIAAGSAEWWVVEVERHTHDVEGHIRPQLDGLADGIYGATAEEYVHRVHRLSEGETDAIDWFNPSFLLIVDLITPQIARAAEAATFEVMQCSVFRSRLSTYALTVEGVQPRIVRTRPEPGVDLELVADQDVAVLRRCGSARLPASTGRIKVATREFRDRRAYAGRAIALPLSVDAFVELVGSSSRYRLTAGGEIVALRDAGVDR